jgi:hypothetical protein
MLLRAMSLRTITTAVLATLALSGTAFAGNATLPRVTIVTPTVVKSPTGVFRMTNVRLNANGVVAGGTGIGARSIRRAGLQVAPSQTKVFTMP